MSALRATLVAAPEAFDAGIVEVEGEAYRHLFRARRLAIGEALRVVDGAGRARRGTVESVDRRRATITLGDPLAPREPSRHVELLVGTPRPERADWLVEKATELGASAVRFLATERTLRALSPARLERLERVARAAVEQCGRARIPALSGVHAWGELPALLEPWAERWVLTPDGPAGEDGLASPQDLAVSSGVSRAASGSQSCSVCIGPEGGFTADEVAALRALGCRPARLGSRVLRVETAALAAVTLLLAAS
ncbi:MAG: RsmE family RNA methyltransferase [Acidobacteriota bacterium]